MSLLAPLFLAGIALVVGPILFHLIRQAPRNRIVFSSTEFLDPSAPKTEQRSRIQNPWLLLLRCLIIALLALAFARPFFNPQESPSLASDLQRDWVIAIDESASMGREGLWQAAIEETLGLARSLGNADRLSVLAFSDQSRPVLSAEQWSEWPRDQRLALLRDALERKRPSARLGHLDLGIEAAIEELATLREARETHGLGEIALVSDFAQGAELSGLPGIEWPADSSFRRVRVGPSQPSNNVGLRWLGWQEREDDRASARLALLRDNPGTPLEVTLVAADATDEVVVAEPVTLLLDEKSESLVSLELPAAARFQPLRFTLSGDSDSFDNTLHVAPEFVPQASVGLLSQHSRSNPKEAPYFIEKAIDGFDQPKTRLVAEDALLSNVDAVIVERPLSSNEVAALRALLDEGKSALILAADPRLSATIEQLSGQSGWSLGPEPANALLVGSIDFAHPLFQPFADPRFNNFANIRFWEARSLTYPDNSDVRELASYDNGDPLLLEVKVGQGALYVWAGSWRPAASQWALSSKFAPWMHRFVTQASGGTPLPSNAVFSAESVSRYSAIDFETPPQSAGLYRVVGSTPDRWIAFQLPPSESDLVPITDDAWDRMGLPSFDPSAQTRRIERIASELNRENSAQAEQRQSLWQWILLAALCLLAIESLMAIRIAKQRELAAS